MSIELLGFGVSYTGSLTGGEGVMKRAQRNSLNKLTKEARHHGDRCVVTVRMRSVTRRNPALCPIPDSAKCRFSFWASILPSGSGTEGQVGGGVVDDFGAPSALHVSISVQGPTAPPSPSSLR